MLPWILLAVLGQQPREDLPTHEKVGTQYPTTEYKYKPDVATTYEQWRSTATVKPGYLKPKARYVKDTTFIPTEQKLEKFETSFPAAVEPKKYLKKPKARYATFTPTVREFKKFETSVPEARLYKPKEAKIELEYDNSYHPKSDYIYYPKSDAYGMYANGVYNYDVPTEDYGYDIYYPKTHDYGMYANGVYNYDAPTKDYGYVNGHYDSQYPTDYHYENTYDNTYEPSSVYGHYDSQYPTDYHYENTYDNTYEPSSVYGHYDSQYPTDYHYENTYDNTYEPSSVYGHYDSQYPTHYDYENTYNHYTYGPSSGYTDDIMLEKESSNEPTSAVDDSHYDDSEAKHPEDHDSKNSYDNSHDSPSVEDTHYDDSEAKHPEDHESKNSHDNSYDSHSDEHDSHHDEEKHDGPPECLMSCEFGEDFHNDMCMWWEHQDPRHNPESCFDNCSPGIIFYFESNCEEPELNEEENEEDPFACVMDCPIEDLDPHSAESFCPWFSTHKATECFMDCSNDFLNMAQDHAEHTCAEFAQEDQFTSYIHYIEEPLIDILEEEKMKYEHSCPPGFMQNADICQVCPAATYSFIGQHDCTPCPEGLTSFPGSESETECYERKALNIVDSDSYSSHQSEDNDTSKDSDINSSYQSEDKSYDDMSEDSDINSSYQSEDKSHDDMSSKEQFEGEHGEDFDNSKVSGELEVPAGQEYSTSAEDMKKEAQLHN